MSDAALLQRRLATFRRSLPQPPVGPASVSSRGSLAPAAERAAGAPTRVRRGSAELAERLASAIDGEVVATSVGLHVRREPMSIPMPIDRDRLASLPGQPPAGIPLLCLDTETTGLATAAGTVAFLVGLGWWEGDRFRQLQLLLPDHSDEAALLDALASAIPPSAWLVTYNGRGFDWPLLVARFRMARRGPPLHEGHLDLLPTVRRLFRHRLPDARLRTVEQELLEIHRIGDVEGWEIPGRYHAFLRGESAETLSRVVRHNELDVVSLARLLCHLDDRLGDPEHRRAAPAGDLAGLARAFAALRRNDEALACLDSALAGAKDMRTTAVRAPTTAAVTTTAEPIRVGTAGPAWPESADRGEAMGLHGRLARPIPIKPWRSGGSGWRPASPPSFDRDRIQAERARLLRRMGDPQGALTAWRQLASGGGRLAALGWVETAKIEEHLRRDPVAALRAVLEAECLADRSRRLGRPLPFLEVDLARRRHRLVRRLASTGSAPALSPNSPPVPGEALGHAPAYR